MKKAADIFNTNFTRLSRLAPSRLPSVHISNAATEELSFTVMSHFSFHILLFYTTNSHFILAFEQQTLPQPLVRFPVVLLRDLESAENSSYYQIRT